MKKSEIKTSHFGLKYIATACDTDGAYFMAETIIPAGDPGPPAHIHTREDEAFYLQSGELTFYIDGNEHILKPGQFLNIQKGEKHTWRNTSQTAKKAIVVFAPAGTENMFAELEKNTANMQAIGKKYGTDFLAGE
jgi:quercetin dioxygenase-like cupin family protein